MQELIDMLRDMAGACKRIAASNPTGMTHAMQAVRAGNFPGIRTGMPLGLMLRIYIEKENNDANREMMQQAQDQNNNAWNTLWHDPELHHGEP